MSSASAGKSSSFFRYFSNPRRRTSVSLPLSAPTNPDISAHLQQQQHQQSQHPHSYPFPPRPGHPSDRTSPLLPLHSPMKASHGLQAWVRQGQRSRYLKFAVFLTFFLGIVFLFGPRDRSEVERYVESHNPFTATDKTFPSPLSGPSSPLLTTTRCKKPHSATKPLIQYALIVDAGSTGSRIHIYRFNNCGPTPELEDEIFEQVPPREGGAGLSSYGPDAEAAARSLDVLLDVAVKHVPDEVKSCTPIAVKATAGLRKLGPELSDNILAAVRHRLETEYPFPVLSADKGGVEVMEGTDEGVYAWITVNYLLGKIGGPDKNPTAAVFDLGGGSTQIVFEPTFKDSPSGGMPKSLADGEHKYELDFGGRKFTLYQHSYLGYGLMAARNNLHRLVVESIYAEKAKQGPEHQPNPDDRSWLSRPIRNPCLNPGSSRTVTVELSPGHPLGESVKVEMVGPDPAHLVGQGPASSVQCRGLIERTLSKDAPCSLDPCSFQGVHQPSLSSTFADEDVFLFSYFYDRTRELGMPDSFTLRDLKAVLDQVCVGEANGGWDLFGSVPGAVTELRGRPEECLDLAYMYTLLHSGYGMPIEREVRIAKKLKGMELGWCLGASLPMLSPQSGWSCRIKEVTNN